MNKENEEIYSFIAEWFDPEPQVIRKYLFQIDSQDHVQMKELNKGCFLKRTYAPNVSRNNLMIGATVQLLSRDFKLVDYGDDYTKKSLEKFTEKCILVLRVSSSRNDLALEQVIISAENKALTLSTIVSFNSDVAMEFRGYKSREKIRSMISNSLSSETALVALSETLADVEILKQQFFQKKININEILPCANITCCIIKPHIVRERCVGSVLKDIVSKHNCVYSNIQSFYLDRECASEFFEVYKEAGPVFKEIVDEMCSGTCIVLIVHKHVEYFRSIVAGPFDVEVAKILCPESLRSKFGHNMAQNAIHCTDLFEEKDHEIKYFFDILADIQKI